VVGAIRLERVLGRCGRLGRRRYCNDHEGCNDAEEQGPRESRPEEQAAAGIEVMRTAFPPRKGGERHVG